jgi:hypothetical protein
MDGFGWMMLLVIGLPVLFAFAAAMQSQGLQSKFANLGVLKGRTKAEIVAAVGEPNSVSALAHGQQILQWTIPGYHIALIFTEDICDGVSHEHAA